MRAAERAGGVVKITLREMDKAKSTALRSGKEVILRDSKLEGFAVRVFPSGTVKAIVRFRVNGKRELHTFGGLDVLTLEEARERARKLLADAQGGISPGDRKRAERQALRVRDVAEAFDREHIATKKDSTAAEYRRQMTTILLPALGKERIKDVDAEKVASMLHRLKDRPVLCNRVRALASKFFRWAEVHGYRAAGTNPCLSLPRRPEQKKERFLKPAEVDALAKALCEMESKGSLHPSLAGVVRFLLLTGCRLGEATGLRWQDVDFPAGTVTITDHKTIRVTGSPKRLHIIPPVEDLLRGLPRAGSPWVFPSTTGTRLDKARMERAWQRIRSNHEALNGGEAEAMQEGPRPAPVDLSDVRLHDLRHTYASTLAGEGVPLATIGKLLGHRHVATTARYAHLAEDATRKAAEKAGAALIVLAPKHA